MDQNVSLGALWDRLWSRRRPIFTFVLIATLISAGIAYVVPVWYRADAELLPPGEEESGVGLASLLRGLAVPGVKIPTQVTPADVFLAVLQSRRISEQMVERFDLMRVYKRKFRIDTIKELRRHASFKLTQAGTIQISVEDRDRKRAAEMANAYVELLDLFNRQVRTSKGRRTRQFIETRLVETRRELIGAEHRLAQYQTQHKTIVLTPGMSTAVEQAARLYGRRTALQLRLGVIRSYSQGSEEELQIQQELAQLDRQMRALPETGLELARLVREVKALEQVFALLTAQYEDARIQEARDVVTVEVLDVATPPERKSRPQRVIIVAAAFLLSFAIASAWGLLRKEEHAAPVMRAVAGS